MLSCDASQYGIGAVLSQVYNGDEKPVAYTSRTLNTAECNYSQWEKEALALIFGVKKFHTYLVTSLLSTLTISHYKVCLVLTGYDYNTPVSP